MPRPCCLRHIACKPRAGLFMPAGVPACTVEEVTLTLDEVEALRLADLNGLYQEQAAEKMKISRPTFSRVVEEARRKVADALIHGKSLRLEGGAVRMIGDAETPETDGTGSLGEGPGMGSGPCGCPRHRGGVGSGSRADGRCNGRRSASPSRRSDKGQEESSVRKGEQQL
jgi:predicted DNA-binding protein (UPF0251 family)